MQTTTQRKQLEHAYASLSVSPRGVVRGCACGLGVVSVISITGVALRDDDVDIADRMERERGRLALTQAASEHRRELFVNREQLAGNGSLIRTAYGHDPRTADPH